MIGAARAPRAAGPAAPERRQRRWAQIPEAEAADHVEGVLERAGEPAATWIGCSLVGLLPTTVRMCPGRLALGYTEVRLVADSPLGAAGTRARGHEFHASSMDPVPAHVKRIYQASGRAGSGVRSEGFLVGSAVMSYVHLHFASAPGLAAAFVDACERGRAELRC